MNPILHLSSLDYFDNQFFLQFYSFHNLTPLSLYFFLTFLPFLNFLSKTFIHQFYFLYPQPVADFTQQLAALHDRHSEELQILVETFRKRNADIRKERSVNRELLFLSPVFFPFHVYSIYPTYASFRQ